MFKKLISESLFEFQKGLDPVDSLGMGRIPIIKDWLKKNEIDLSCCTINSDYTIDYDGHNGAAILYFRDLNIQELPEFIEFNNVYGNLMIVNCSFTSFRGFPKKIMAIHTSYGCLNIEHNKTMFESLDNFPEYVRYNFICTEKFIEKFSVDKINQHSFIGLNICIH